jgi:DNA processing protein
MIINKLTVTSLDYPAELRKFKTPPKLLFHAGVSIPQLLKQPSIAIVGTRHITPYGEQVTYKLARQLAEQGIIIVSGLAFGVDSIAHRAALDAKVPTIAVLPGPLEKIYPSRHERLAVRIIEQGGALLSEYPAGTPAFKQNFIARNRLVAGLARAVLVTEAGKPSGSSHTVKAARKQQTPVLAVPGNITSPASAGTNELIQEGAAAVTDHTDVLKALGLHEHQIVATEVRGRSAEEQKVLDLLLKGVNDGDQLLQRSALAISDFNQVLTMLEIDGKIRSLGANQWALC